ncbi:MAG: hypothetical protein FWF87_07750 [Synergistaceae bacterium]|nr:hypothetical protein [Synergistaceae bacterium]
MKSNVWKLAVLSASVLMLLLALALTLFLNFDSSDLVSVTDEIDALTTDMTNVPVTDIIYVPEEATVNMPLPLTGTVLPASATNKDIVSSLFSRPLLHAKSFT